MTIAPSATQNSGGSGTQLSSEKMALKAEDFISMMITQLQNQDPMEPAKNEALLAQMSQIGQLQSATQLQASLKTMVLQNNIGAAGNLIGKEVKGLDDANEEITGTVSSVRIEKDSVYLELDNGRRLAMNRVTEVAPSAVATAGTKAPTNTQTQKKAA